MLLCRCSIKIQMKLSSIYPWVALSLIAGLECDQESNKRRFDQYSYVYYLTIEQPGDWSATLEFADSDHYIF